MEEVQDCVECSEATSQPQLPSDQWTTAGVWVVGTEDAWTSECRSLAKLPLDVPKKMPLEEGEEEEDKIETKTMSSTPLDHDGEMTVVKVQ